LITSGFKQNKPILRPGIVLPEGVNNYNMVLHTDPEPEAIENDTGYAEP
jgi:hypothetical protein